MLTFCSREHFLFWLLRRCETLEEWQYHPRRYLGWLFRAHSIQEPLEPALQHAVATTLGLLATEEDMFDAITALIATAKTGKVAGRGRVLAEYFQALWPQFVMALSAGMLRLPSTGAPLEWRGGLMWPSQRRGDAPLSWEHARGLLCGNHMGKLYAPLLRQQAMEYVL